MPTLAINKKAKFNYEILDTHEAGMVLFGHEVKALRDGQASLKGSYISIRTKNKKAEMYLINCQISRYRLAGPLPDYNPMRERKLLLNRLEINHLVGKKNEQGLTLIPLKIYTKHSLIKLEFAVAKGKKKHDKREAIKKRDIDKRLRSLTKQR